MFEGKPGMTWTEQRTARELAAAWARSVLEREIVILDTETTGLWPEDEIVEIAAVDRHGLVLFEQRIQPRDPSRLLKRDRKTGRSAADIHGITPSMLVGQPGFAEIFPALRELINFKSVVIYNADYDMRMLRQDCDRHGLNLPLVRAECAMLKFAAWNGAPGRTPGEYRWTRLEEAVSILGLHGGTFDQQAHSALGDCQRTLAVLRGMAADGQ